MSHKKDLTPTSFAGKDDVHVVIAHDGSRSNLPILRTLFLNGQELLMPEGVNVSLQVNDKDLTELTLTVLPTSIELIDEDEMQERLIKE